MSLIKRLDKKSILVLTAEFSLATVLIYSLFYAATSLGLRYFVLSNRGMVEHTTSGNILPGSWDVFVWAFALFVGFVFLSSSLRRSINGEWRSLLGLGLFVFLSVFVVVLAVFGFINVVFLIVASVLFSCLCFWFSASSFGVSRSDLFFRVLFGCLLVFLMIEVASFVLFNGPVALGLNPGSLGLHWDLVELSFANLVYPLIPYAYLLFVLVAVVGFVFQMLPNVWKFLIKIVQGENFVERFGRILDFGEAKSLGFGFLRGRFVVGLAVLVSSVLSCLFVVFTLVPWSNPTGMLVSVDSPNYYDWISHMGSLDINSALSFAFSNDRALFLVLCYGLSFFIPTLWVVQFAAALLLVALSVFSVFVLRLFTNSTAVLSIGALLVPFSFQGLGLIYSGFFANMLALILVFAYAVLFFRLLKKWSSLSFLTLLSVSIFILFAHSWTWFIFILSLAMFLILELRLAYSDRHRLKDKTLLIGVTIGIGLLVDLLRTTLFSISSTGSVFGVAQSSLGFPNAAYLVSGMQQSVNHVLGGVFANQLLVALGFVGLLALLKIKSEVSNFFVAWTCVACASVLFATDSLVFNRALFMVPWIMLSSFGLASIGTFMYRKLRVNKRCRDWRYWMILVFIAFVFLALLNSSLRYLFNINIW